MFRLSLKLFHFMILKILLAKILLSNIWPTFSQNYIIQETSGCYCGSFSNWPCVIVSFPEVVFLIQIWWLQLLHRCAFPPCRDTTEPLQRYKPGCNTSISFFMQNTIYSFCLLCVVYSRCLTLVIFGWHYLVGPRQLERLPESSRGIWWNLGTESHTGKIL